MPDVRKQSVLANSRYAPTVLVFVRPALTSQIGGRLGGIQARQLLMHGPRRRPMLLWV